MKTLMGIAIAGVLLTMTLLSAGRARAENADPPACVILLHGLARTHRSMDDMAGALEAAGYRVANIDYPSTRYSVEQLAQTVITEGLSRCRAHSAAKVHFVTHSMGGIVLRYYLSRFTVTGLGRVVMLSPPNQGSEAADELKEVTLYRWINGPAGQQLGTGPEDLPASLGPVNFPLGIITGSRHSFFDRWLADLIPGEDDGKVSVERAKVQGMTDFLVRPYSHTFIMQEKEVIEQTLHFLRHGRFQRTVREPPTARGLQSR